MCGGRPLAGASARGKAPSPAVRTTTLAVMSSEPSTGCPSPQGIEALQGLDESGLARFRAELAERVRDIDRAGELSLAPGERRSYEDALRSIVAARRSAEAREGQLVIL